MKIQWVVKLSKLLSGKHTGGTELQALKSRFVKTSSCMMYLCDCMYIWFPKEVTSWQFKFCGLLQYVHVYCQQKLLIEIPNTLYSSLICFVLDTNHKQMACLYILSMYVLYMRITFVIQQLTYNVGTVQYPAVHVCEHFENMLLALTLFPQSMLSHLLFNM